MRGKLFLKYGRRWRDHVVPEPKNIPAESGIGDLAPGARNDTPPGLRREKSRALARRIASSCAGHAQPPSPPELYQAFHTATPTERGAAVLRMWMTEASKEELIDAWIDHCYTWRELAAACRRHGIRDAVNADIVTRMGRAAAESAARRTRGNGDGNDDRRAAGASKARDRPAAAHTESR